MSELPEEPWPIRKGETSRSIQATRMAHRCSSRNYSYDEASFQFDWRATEERGIPKEGDAMEAL